MTIKREEILQVKFCNMLVVHSQAGSPTPLVKRHKVRIEEVLRGAAKVTTENGIHKTLRFNELELLEEDRLRLLREEEIRQQAAKDAFVRGRESYLQKRRTDPEVAKAHAEAQRRSATGGTLHHLPPSRHDVMNAVAAAEASFEAAQRDITAAVNRAADAIAARPAPQSDFDAWLSMGEALLEPSRQRIRELRARRSALESELADAMEALDREQAALAKLEAGFNAFRGKP